MLHIRLRCIYLIFAYEPRFLGAVAGKFGLLLSNLSPLQYFALIQEYNLPVWAVTLLSSTG